MCYPHRRAGNHEAGIAAHHRGNLTLNRALSKHLDFAFSDTFLHPQDPLAEPQQVEEVESVRESLSLSARGDWDETDNRVMLTITGTRLFRR